MPPRALLESSRLTDAKHAYGQAFRIRSLFAIAQGNSASMLYEEGDLWAGGYSVVQACVGAGAELPGCTEQHWQRTAIIS
jgi:hypothetical protein